MRGLEPSVVEEIRHHTRSGKPLGDREFLKWIERKLGYPVELKPRGRPRKADE